MILWQYSETKTLEWLSPKIDRVSKVLISQQLNVNPNAAISSSFKISDKTIDPSEGNINSFLNKNKKNVTSYIYIMYCKISKG